MSNEINSLYPDTLWKNFNDLCGIPRPSKHEEKVTEFVKNFGEGLGLKTIVDEVGNVIIKKPATPGMQDRMGVVLQGHLDMVPQKNSDVEHDFIKDPIQPYIDGEWVTARGTTLGADNGMGVAAAMAVLQSKEIQHGPVEALFTIDEETGMTGAFALKPGLLDGDILINMDSEDEGELYIGCAGGVDTNVRFRYNEESVPDGMEAFELKISGLKGGHSGLDIDLGRGNANKLMNRFLSYAQDNFGIRLASFKGGDLRNAIPREAFATVVVPAAQKEEFLNGVKKYEELYRSEYNTPEPGLTLTASPAGMPSSVIDKKTQENLIRSVYACPNGVIGKIADMPEVVETSTNLAIVKAENGIIDVCSLLRSSVDTLKDDLANMIQCVFELAGAEVEHTGSYPGWKPNVDSPVLKTMKSVYEKMYSVTPEVKVIHAGLECGIIGDVYPDMDLISFGPTIRFPHSPDEKVNIETVGKFWDFLLETLKNIPSK